jgi:predicted transcriptional regulator
MKQTLSDPVFKEKVIKALKKGSKPKDVAAKYDLNFSTVRQLHKTLTNETTKI